MGYFLWHLSSVYLCMESCLDCIFFQINFLFKVVTYLNYLVENESWYLIENVPSSYSSSLVVFWLFEHVCSFIYVLEIAYQVSQQTSIVIFIGIALILQCQLRRTDIFTILSLSTHKQRILSTCLSFFNVLQYLLLMFLHQGIIAILLNLFLGILLRLQIVCFYFFPSSKCLFLI